MRRRKSSKKLKRQSTNLTMEKAALTRVIARELRSLEDKQFAEAAAFVGERMPILISSSSGDAMQEGVPPPKKSRPKAR
jgi:hypothetical protein